MVEPVLPEDDEEVAAGDWDFETPEIRTAEDRRSMFELAKWGVYERAAAAAVKRETDPLDGESDDDLMPAEVCERDLINNPYVRGEGMMEDDTCDIAEEEYPRTRTW